MDWSVSPVIFSIGSFQVRYYSLMFAMAFYVGYLTIRKITSDQGVLKDSLDEMVFTAFLAVLVGARLGHVLFYDPVYYLSNPLEIFKVWKGGLASHGAIALYLLTSFYYIRKYKTGLIFMLDCIAISISGAVFFIRIGNFFNSEIIGYPTSVPWGIVFSRIDDIPRHPAQLYEALGYFIAYFIMLSLHFKFKIKLGSGKFFAYITFMLSFVRFFAEFFKENQAHFEGDLPLKMGQMLNIPLVLAGIAVLLYRAKYKFDESSIQPFKSSDENKSPKVKAQNHQKKKRKK